MGVVNVTPDSFSDGGAFLDPSVAVAHGLQLARDGAEILDVGGEATNPKAQPVTPDEELARVLPVIEQLVAAGLTVSIDTTKAVVARAAVAAGASIVNDVSGGLFDPTMAETIHALPGVTYICGHLRGTNLAEVFAAEVPLHWHEVVTELAVRISHLPADRTWVDPGIGFGKGADGETNLALLRHAGDISRELGRPVVVGPSRKRFLRRLAEASGVSDDPLLLDVASTAACLGGARNGAQIVRTHNVALLAAALAVYTKL